MLVFNSCGATNTTPPCVHKVESLLEEFVTCSQTKIAERKIRIVLLTILTGVMLAACTSPPPAKSPTQRKTTNDRPYTSATNGSSGSCSEYAEQAASRELQREFDVMSGNFRGGDSRVFQDFARMDAQRQYQRLYESCLRNKRSRKK